MSAEPAATRDSARVERTLQVAAALLLFCLQLYLRYALRPALQEDCSWSNLSDCDRLDSTLSQALPWVSAAYLVICLARRLPTRWAVLSVLSILMSLTSDTSSASSSR